jgi:hypothetical protein
MTQTEKTRRIVKTYRGRNHVTAYAVREYITDHVYETLGTYATEEEAAAHLHTLTADA